MELEKIFINDAVLIIETTDESDEELINGATTPPREINLINDTVKEQLKEKLTKEQKNEYNKKRYKEKTEHIKELNRKAYIKKLQDDPNYRHVLNEKTKQRHQKQKEKLISEGLEVKPKGRPRKYEQREKKANGRPRKYNL
jgi:hypothetical protein